MPKLIDHAQRRADIAVALWRIIMREGISGVSIREVAAEAGISTGSLRHVFATKEELLEFSMRLVYEQAAARIERHRRMRSPRRRAEAMIAELLPLDAERAAEMRVHMAMNAESVAHPVLVDAAREAHEGLRTLCHVVLDDLRCHGLIDSAADLDVEAMRLHAVIDGLAMHLLVSGTDTPDQVRALVRAHLASLATVSVADG
ncbi:TetR/AcrR family transcriptional regulator [Gordonia sp. NPDC003422]